MTRHSVIDPTGNHEENIERLGKDLGKAQLRRKLFNTVYGRGSRPRSKKELMAQAGIKAKDSQQAQNEIEYLYKKHLIDRAKNEGYAADRSQYVYSKNEFVRANREKIVRVADNPKFAARIPTKRRPVVRGGRTIVVKTITRSVLKGKKRLDVLYSTANPDPQSPLRVDAEIRQVQEVVRGSKLRDSVALHYRPAANLTSIMDGLNDLEPGIVHFSGHGFSGGIAVDHAKVKPASGKVVTFDLLAKAVGAVDNPPQVIVLNSCHSAGAKSAFLPPAKAIVVMGDSISDLAATAFAARFYAAIASGQSLQAAFEQGLVAIEAVSISEAKTPQLLVANGVNAKKLVLA